MGDPRSDFRRSVTALREVIEELPSANRELRQLLATTERTMKVLEKQAESIGAQTEHTLDTLARLGTQSEQQLPMLAQKLGNTLDSLNATALQVQETTRTNGEALREVLTQAPELVRGSGELVRDSQEIAGAARRSWLLRDYLEPSEMRTLPVDSFESFGKR
jgi:ABC-type transporter Mla subunit MlaD